MVLSFLACAFVALVLGYLLATPDDTMSLGVTGLVLFVLSFPLMMKWHYPIMIFSWNASMIPFFIPGRLDLWVLMAMLSLTISVLRRTVDKETEFLKASSITIPLIFLCIVIIITAKLTGGIGLAVLGSKSFGGKKYLYLFAAIIGYFALTAQAIPRERAKLYTVLFFLSGLTAILSNLAYMGGPAFYFLFALFPVEGAIGQATASQGIGDNVVRIAGLGVGCLGIFCTLLARNGVRETLNIRRPWKPALLLVASFAGLFAGFRSVLIFLSLVFVILFFLEGLHRTRFLPIFIAGLILVGIVTIPLVQKMPFSVQRALSILPIKVDPVARADAEASNEWRLQMWRLLIPQIPQYLLKGKGYAIDPTDLYMSEQLSTYGWADSNDTALLAGDYHSGPLSVIIPFGIFGAIGFLWFLGAAIRGLYFNYRYGDPSLQRINTFLLAYFVAKTIFFFAIFGAFSSDLFTFVGLIGLSISLNGGIKQKKAVVSRMDFPVRNAAIASA